MKIKTIIIEDEEKIREVLKIKINTQFPNLEIISEANNIETAYAEIKKHNPQLIFLDVEMPGGTGFDLLERFDDITFEIIITTGYSNYGLQALKVSAVDYLLKPIKSDELETAVNNALTRIDERARRKKYALLKHNLQYLNDQRTKISVTHLGEIFFISIKDIIRCEAYEKYTYIHTVQKDRLLSKLGIGTYDDLLLPFGFCRCHKSHSVNGKHILKYNKTQSSVKLSDSSIVPIARRKKNHFEEFIESLK